jgi:hypothetical protein
MQHMAIGDNVNKTFYITEEENEWVKRQEPGIIRAIIQSFMERYPDKVPLKEEK